MNKTPIEWVRNPDGSKGYTWNPVVGCRRGCDYCYARRFAERGLGEYGMYEKGSRFQPRFFDERLPQPLLVKKPSRIFVCSMGELFGPWVSEEWQRRVLGVAEQAKWHTFMFLTKYPEALAQLNPWPDNAWVGATATNHDEAARALGYLQGVDASIRYLSLEPLLGPIRFQPLSGPDWIIIGAQTGPGAGDTPEFEWVRNLTSFAKGHGIALFLKDNLHWCEPCQEWPR